MRATTAGMPRFDSKPAGEAVASPALGLGNRTHVHVAERAQADAHTAVGLFFQHAGHFGLRRATHDVDEPFDLFESDVVASQHVLRDRRPHEPLLDVELGGGQAPRPGA